MNLAIKTTLFTAALCLGTSPLVGAAEPDDVEALREELRALRNEVTALRAQQEADREKAFDLIKKNAEARADSNSVRALAGIDENGKIFLRSSDGGFSASIFGQIQFRYVWNSQDDAAGRDTSLSGFQFRRAKLGVKGDVAEGWGYKFVLATNRGTGPGGGNVFTEDAYITYDFGGGWSMLAGTNKLPFARQEIVSSTRQVGVDRGLATEFFTLNRTDQFAVGYEADRYQATVAVSDGGNADFTGFAANSSNDPAVTGRVDWMVLGEDWGAGKDEFAGVASDALFVGGAVHYENATGATDPGLAWTLDTLYKTGDLSLTAAVFGHHTTLAGGADVDQLGFYAQGDYKITSKKDVFARWEFVDDDDAAGAGTDPLQAITLGLNHHFNKRVKLTSDVVWIYAGDAPSAGGSFINGGATSSGLGLSGTGFGAGSGHGDQVAFRMQLQLLF